ARRSGRRPPPARRGAGLRWKASAPRGSAGRPSIEGVTMPRPVVSNASTAWKGDLLSGSGTTTLETSQLGTFDLSWKARSEEAEKGTTSPEELLGAAHAACYSMQFSNMLAENGTPPTSVDTSAAVTFNIGEGGITGIALSVTAAVDGIEDADFQRLADEAKSSCPASKALPGVAIPLQAKLACGAPARRTRPGPPPVRGGSCAPGPARPHQPCRPAPARPPVTRTSRAACTAPPRAAPPAPPPHRTASDVWTVPDSSGRRHGSSTGKTFLAQRDGAQRDGARRDGARQDGARPARVSATAIAGPARRRARPAPGARRWSRPGAPRSAHRAARGSPGRCRSRGAPRRGAAA